MIALGVMVIVSYQFTSTKAIKGKEVRFDVALKEIPIIKISGEETAFMQNLRQNTDVKAAIENEKITELFIKKGTELAADKLPDDIKVSEFSVIYKTVYFGYFTNGYRVTLDISMDNKIHKTIVVYSSDGKVKTVYVNFENKVILKSIF